MQKHRWVAFVLPLLVYLLIGALEPSPNELGGARIGLAISYASYPLIYTLKIAVTLAAVALVWPAYREFPFRVTPLGIGLGVAGIFVWIALATGQRSLLEWIGAERLEAMGLKWLADAGARPAFNPLETLSDQPAMAWAFLAVRFAGLALVVPIIEEFFLRGFLLRWVVRQEWWTVPFGQVNRLAVAAAVIVPVLMHPMSELLAAVAWFSMVTWLMVRTRSIWDCVAAHMATNLLLGIYVLARGEWWLW